MKSTIALLSLVVAIFTSQDARCQIGLSPAATPAGLLAYVDVEDGVSRSEANDIAQAYFLHHVGCGSYSGISENLGFWVVEGNFGYSGAPIEGFLINKRTGAVTSPIGPSYESPGDMLLGPNNSFKPNPHQGGLTARLRLYPHSVAALLRVGLIQALGLEWQICRNRKFPSSAPSTQTGASRTGFSTYTPSASRLSPLGSDFR